MNKQKPLSEPRAMSLYWQRKEQMLQRWYNTYIGQVALKQLSTLVQDKTADIFGYYALELGTLAAHHTFLDQSRISHRLRVGVSWSAPPRNQPLAFLTHPEQLSLDFGSIDLLLGSHLLELATHPHAVLREVERVLMPEGHFILIGFNPLGWYGLNQRFQDFGKNKALKLRFYHPWRVQDWLELLGFEVLASHSLSYRPNMGGMRVWYATRWWERIHELLKLPTGNLYVIHARKKISAITPIMPKRIWRQDAVLKPAGIVVSSGVENQVNMQAK